MRLKPKPARTIQEILYDTDSKWSSPREQERLRAELVRAEAYVVRLKEVLKAR